MAGQSDIGVSSEVYSWLSSISNGLNLQRLAPEFERRGFRSKHSLKYMNENDLEIIINSPDKLLLAERRILEKELQELKKPSLQPKELFPPSSHGPLQFASQYTASCMVHLAACQCSRLKAPQLRKNRAKRQQITPAS